MRHRLGPAVGAAILLVTASAGCSSDDGSATVPTVSPAPSSVAASSPVPQDLTEVIDRTRTTLIASGAVGAETPGPQGLLLVQAWAGSAAYVWETRDQRLCSAKVTAAVVTERACAVHPLDPPVASPGGVQQIDTFFTDGWVRLFGADHQEVTSATCGGTPLEVRRVGTVAGGVRTLYAVWFTDYTKGSIVVSLSHDGTTSEASLALGDLGDRTCVPAL
ncbi:MULTISPECIES: hypothetical protein [unclassified Kitasatospora]|uniref:hypothetical protein n=1 Tax=unclassified Kitasatospora TaxID=2633591 RepID=UPI000B152FC8|nr:MULTISPECIES: hypothetical protein [unclassified Kitasatospora]